jgi:hypothetical protein
MHGHKDTPAFPQKMPALTPTIARRNHCETVGLFVAYQHLGLHAIVDQRFHQPVGSHSSPSRLLTCIDNQYSHAAKIRLSEHKSKRKLAFFVLSSESILFKSSEKNDLAKRIETFLLKFVSQKELTGVL